MDLSRYRTYQWLSQQDVDNLRLRNPRVDYLTQPVQIRRNPEVEAIVRTEAEKKLQSFGFKPVTNGHPDFFVTFYGKARDEDWVSSWEGQTRGGGYASVPAIIAPNYDQDFLNSYREGTVYLVIYDAKTRKPSWAGHIKTESFGPEFGPPQIASAVNELMTDFKKNT